VVPSVPPPADAVESRRSARRRLRRRRSCVRNGLAATAFILLVPTIGPTSPAMASASAVDDGAATSTAAPGSTARTSVPPRSAGYFGLRPVGAWSRLPSGSQCRTRVHKSTWEPRPANTKRNHQMPNGRAVHRSLANRPRNTDNTYDRRWDHWLMRRVAGHYTGTTDEIFQWAACKWGLPDNVLRAIAVRESTWYQYLTHSSGGCVSNWGCGDLVSEPTHATHVYCDGLARVGGYDYQEDYGAGICPKTFSIVGVMSWENPDWGKMAGNQNGTFPFNRRSTAFAVDYISAYLRGCYEGWVHWLDNTGTRDYSAGQLWGCVGSWYAGAWRDQAARGYIHRVRTELRNRTWLRSGWASNKPFS
jgi:hypothetical protein